MRHKTRTTLTTCTALTMLIALAAPAQAQRIGDRSRATGQPCGAWWMGHPRHEVDVWQRRGGGIVSLQGQRNRLAGRRHVLQGQYHGFVPAPIHGSTSPYGHGYGNYSFRYQYGIDPQHYAPMPYEALPEAAPTESRFGPAYDPSATPQLYWPPELGPSPLEPAPVAPPTTLYVLLAAPPQQPTPAREAHPLLAGEQWDLLRAGDATRAEHLFAMIALRAPEASLPKLGFAMCAAMQQNDGKALRGLRRALATDAAALRLVADDENLSAQVRDLAERYAGDESSDGQLLAAAFFYVVDEPSRVQRALAAAGTSEQFKDVAARLTELVATPAQAAAPATEIAPSSAVAVRR